MPDHLPQTAAPNVPSAKPTPTGNFCSPWSAPRAEVEAMLEAPPIGADWPLYAAGAIKGSFYVPDMSRDERQAWLASFAAVLGDLPAPFVNEGFQCVLRRGGSMRPTPGDIYVEAKRLRDNALDALKTRAQPSRLAEPEKPDGPVVSPEEADRIVARLDSLVERFLPDPVAAGVLRLR